jgi:hypothetical protein
MNSPKEVDPERRSPAPFIARTARGARGVSGGGLTCRGTDEKPQLMRAPDSDPGTNTRTTPIERTGRGPNTCPEGPPPPE